MLLYYKFILIFIFLFGTSLSLLAQQQDSLKSATQSVNDGETEYLIERLVEDADAQEFDFGTEFENLESYKNNPLDLNLATRADLEDLGIYRVYKFKLL